jgi:hypothetical protein
MNPKLTRLVFVGTLLSCGGQPDTLTIDYRSSGDSKNIRESPVFLDFQDEHNFSRVSVEPFNDIGGVAIGPTGDFAVFDRSSGSVTILNSQGARLRTFGRIGAGPGEFSGGPIEIFYTSDEISIVDLRSASLQVFDTGGRLLRSRLFHHHAIRLGSASLPDGGILQAVVSGEDILNTTQRLPIVIERLRGSTIDSVARFTWKRTKMQRSNRRLAAIPRVALTPREILVAAPDVWRIDRFDSLGSPTESWRRRENGQMIGREEADHLLTILKHRMPIQQSLLRVGFPPEVRRAFDGLRIPAIPRIFAGSGMILVQVPIPADSLVMRDGFTFEREGYGSTTWDLYTNSGIHAARLYLPLGFHVSQISNGIVWGYRVDANTSEFVEALRLAVPLSH